MPQTSSPSPLPPPPVPQTSKLAGLSLPYKPRWCVVLPHFPCPKAGASQPVRKQLWVFKDASAVLPKCRVWLDGSSTYQVNHSEAVLVGAPDLACCGVVLPDLAGCAAVRPRLMWLVP